MSPNGSTKTAASGPTRRNADWPYHSTCMGNLRLDVSAAHPRRGGCDEAGNDRERERRVQAGLKRTGDELRKERASRQRRVIGRRQRAERVGSDEMLDRVVAQKRR